MRWFNFLIRCYRRPRALPPFPTRRSSDLHGIGLAAPQVGVGKRIVMFFVPAARNGGVEIPLTLMINPVIEPTGPEQAESSEEHTSALQSQFHLGCRRLLEKKKRYVHASTY